MPTCRTLGFRSVRIDATRFLRQPESFTDFHPEDVAAYGRRFGIDIVATGIIDEQQLLALFEDGLTLAQGPHIAGPARRGTNCWRWPACDSRRPRCDASWPRPRHQVSHRA